jgi:RND superfamily putative drug exporter
MFLRWGAFIYRHRRITAILSVVAALTISVAGQRIGAELSQGGWLDPTSESARVADHLEADFGTGRGSLIVLVRGPAGVQATSPAFQQAIATTIAPLLDDTVVVDHVGYAETGDERFISTDGTAAYVVIGLSVADEESVDHATALEEQLAPPAGYEAVATGYGPIQRDANAQSQEDLLRAEIVSFPVTLIILVLVFGSLVAASLPLAVAFLLTIPATIGLIHLAAGATEMSIYVENVATMLGLALAIDYSLFIVSRFREELAHGRTVEEAVSRAIGTAGKAVTFSGIAVAIGLSGLLFFRASALASIGIGGSLVVLSSVVFGLTFLPAVLGMLGPRVNALSLRRPIHAVSARIFGRTFTAAHRTSRWERMAHAVMRRPVVVLIPTLAFLIVLGLPFFRLVQGIPDAATLPAGTPSRDAFVAISKEFPAGETTPVVVLAEIPGDPTTADNARALAEYAARLDDLEGIERVEGAFSLNNPQTGAAMTAKEIAAFWSAPDQALGPELAAMRTAVKERYIAGSTVRLDAIHPGSPAEPAATELIPVVRSVEPPAGAVVTVGGVAALGHDFLASQAERMPYAVGVTLLASAIALFLLFGSIVLPIKAVIMTLLSISASFGALVWIFQDGNFSELLAFQPLGYTIAGNAIIMFCVIFGLSMDYEVLLLSRIQEAYRRTADNTASVAEGLARTAGVITGAALIMVSVFAAFALAETITIKSIGVGMAIAVAIDATIIRVLVVPATMRLMGRWNWWAPGPLRRFADRLGFDHVETEDDIAPAPATTVPAAPPASG